MKSKLLFALLIPLLLTGCNHKEPIIGPCPPEVSILESIEIKQLPYKLVYQVGEYVDLTGIKVNAIYDDESIKDVSNFIDYSPKEALLENSNSVTISFLDEATSISKSTSFAITVNPHVEPDPDPDPDPEPEIKELTIKEVRDLCNELTNFNSVDIACDTTKQVTIKGLVIDNIAYGTTVSGYNPDGKTLLMDDTGLIYCSSSTNSQNSLYQKCDSYVGRDDSLYEVTGYISLMRGEPEIVVTSVKLDKAIKVNAKATDFANSISSVDAFIEKTKASNNNQKGNANTTDIVTLTNLTCIAKADDNSWLFVDSNEDVLGVYDKASNTSFTVGNHYDITGSVSLYHWKPSLRSLSHKLNSDTSNFVPTKVVDTTITDILKIKYTPDSYTKIPQYTDAFRNIYKASVYLNYYVAGNVYLTACDKYYANPFSARNSAASLGAVVFNNSDMWDVKYYNTSMFGEAVTKEEKVDIYFSLYQQDKQTYGGSTYYQWKIYAYNF